MDQLSPICLYDFFFRSVYTHWYIFHMKWNMWGLRGWFFSRFVEQFSIVVICFFLVGVRISYIIYDIRTYIRVWNWLPLVNGARPYLSISWLREFFGQTFCFLNFPFKWTRIWSWLAEYGNIWILILVEKSPIYDTIELKFNENMFRAEGCRYRLLIFLLDLTWVRFFSF